MLNLVHAKTFLAVLSERGFRAAARDLNLSPSTVVEHIKQLEEDLAAPLLVRRRGIVEPTYQGYSIGHWIDEDGDGVYDVLEVETRGPFKGPRAYDATGLPLHFDNQSTFKERFHLDKNNPNLLHEEITVFDHALTRPWSVDKTYRRNPNPYPNWSRISCAEGTNYVVIGADVYFLSGDGFLMPTKKDQAPPDPRYFKRVQSVK